MIRSFFVALLATGSLAACATSDTAVVDNLGEVTVSGIAPSEALGAVDAKQIATKPTIANGGEATTAQPNTDDEGTIAVQGAQASAVLSAVDTEKLVDEKAKAPE